MLCDLQVLDLVNSAVLCKLSRHSSFVEKAKFDPPNNLR